MLDNSLIGKTNEVQAEVTAANTAKTLGSGALEVFATPAMCCLMEKAAADMDVQYLDDAHTTVGTSLEIKHTAATPVGMKVTAKAEIIAVEGRKLTFKVTANDEAGEIGFGVHERFVVEKNKFQAKTNAKMQK